MIRACWGGTNSKHCGVRGRLSLAKARSPEKDANNCLAGSKRPTLARRIYLVIHHGLEKKLFARIVFDFHSHIS